MQILRSACWERLIGSIGVPFQSFVQKTASEVEGEMNAESADDSVDEDLLRALGDSDGDEEQLGAGLARHAEETITGASASSLPTKALGKASVDESLEEGMQGRSFTQDVLMSIIASKSVWSLTQSLHMHKASLVVQADRFARGPGRHTSCIWSVCGASKTLSANTAIRLLSKIPGKIQRLDTVPNAPDQNTDVLEIPIIMISYAELALSLHD